jgi:hypothetical protein
MIRGRGPERCIMQENPNGGGEHTTMSCQFERTRRIHTAAIASRLCGSGMVVEANDCVTQGWSFVHCPTLVDARKIMAALYVSGFRNCLSTASIDSGNPFISPSSAVHPVLMSSSASNVSPNWLAALHPCAVTTCNLKPRNISFSSSEICSSITMTWPSSCISILPCTLALFVQTSTPTNPHPAV